MSSKFSRLTTVIGAAVALVAGVLTGTPIAAAGPSPVLATYRVAPGYYSVVSGLNAIWAVNGDEVHDGQLYRIDPATGRKTLVTTLPFPAGGLLVGFGSLWVSDYFGNAVWRLAPDGRVQAEIAVGLQPEWLHVAFGSLWVSNHHGASLSRIDPARNTVVSTVPAGAPDVFRSGPQAITDDGTRVYVGSSNLQALQSVDPATDAVSTPGSIDDQFCGSMVVTGGSVWSVDHCTATTYQLRPSGSVKHAFGSSGMPGGLTTLGTGLWIADDRTVDPNSGQGSNAVLEQRDPTSGALLRTVTIGGDATDITSGAGDLWVYDGVASTIRRIHV